MGHTTFDQYKNFEDERVKTLDVEDDYSDEFIPTGEELNELYNLSAEETVGFYLEEFMGYVSNLMLFIYLCNKFVVKKDFTLSSKETMFLVLMLLKLQFPIIGVGLFAIQIPTTIKIVKGWFKNNTNKRSVLEAELRLIKQI